MNASDFQSALATAAQVPEETVAKVLAHFPGVVLAALAAGDDVVKVRGIAKFQFCARKARRVTNPQTGELLAIPAKRKLCVVPIGGLKYGAEGGDRRESGEAAGAPERADRLEELEVG